MMTRLRALASPSTGGNPSDHAAEEQTDVKIEDEVPSEGANQQQVLSEGADRQPVPNEGADYQSGEDVESLPDLSEIEDALGGQEQPATNLVG